MTRTTTDGRLQQNPCGTPITVSRPGGGTYTNVDDSDLFDPTAPWLNPAIASNPVDLNAAKTALQSGQPNPFAPTPLFTGEIFDCPRFSVVPVVDVATASLTMSTSSPSSTSTRLPVTGFRYAWIGSPDQSTSDPKVTVDNGLIWQDYCFFRRFGGPAPSPAPWWGFGGTFSTRPTSRWLLRPPIRSGRTWARILPRSPSSPTMPPTRRRNLAFRTFPGYTATRPIGLRWDDAPSF